MVEPGGLDTLVRRITLRTGAAAVVTAGLAWAALCFVLARDGHAPSVTLIPIDARGYYLAQAFFVVPLLLVLWAICVVVCAWVARARVTAASAGPVGVALAAPLLVCFLLPDAVVYAISGFAALGRVVRITAPLTFVVTLALVAVAVRATHGVSTARAWLSAAAGVIVQTLAGAPLLR